VNWFGLESQLVSRISVGIQTQKLSVPTTIFDNKLKFRSRNFCPRWALSSLVRRTKVFASSHFNLKIRISFYFLVIFFYQWLVEIYILFHFPIRKSVKPQHPYSKAQTSQPDKPICIHTCDTQSYIYFAKKVASIGLNVPRCERSVKMYCSLQAAPL